MPILKIVSRINYILPTLTPAKQYIYTSDAIFMVLPPPFLGCAEMIGANGVRVNVIETYVFLACGQRLSRRPFAASAVSSYKCVLLLVSFLEWWWRWGRDLCNFRPFFAGLDIENMNECPGLINVSVIDIRAGGPYDLGRYVETYLPTVPEPPLRSLFYRMKWHPYG